MWCLEEEFLHDDPWLLLRNSVTVLKAVELLDDEEHDLRLNAADIFVECAKILRKNAVLQACKQFCTGCGAEEDINAINVATKDHKLSKCAECKVARYCSRDCQVAHWKKHRDDCKDLRAQRDNLEDPVQPGAHLLQFARSDRIMVPRVLRAVRQLQLQEAMLKISATTSSGATSMGQLQTVIRTGGIEVGSSLLGQQPLA
jgi:hypothetical protein